MPPEVDQGGPPAPTGRTDRFLAVGVAAVCLAYVGLLVAMIVADGVFLWSSAPVGPIPPGAEPAAANPFREVLADPGIRYSIRLTLVSCSISTLLSLLVAVPLAYTMSRCPFRGRALIDAALDIPMVLPPLVVGLSLLILMQLLPAAMRNAVVYQVPAVILAQFVVASALAIRTLRATFDQVDPRGEQVAWTLGASRLEAFGRVVLPEIRPGLVTAGTLAWARSLGEFGPLLVFAGATRGKTEVLSTTVYLELGVGNLRGAVAVSLLMIGAAVAVLTVARLLGERRP